MWNCSIILSRNGSLCNSTVNFTTKDSYLKNYVASISRKKLLSTNAVTITEHLSVNKSPKCHLSRSLMTISNHTFKYTRTISNSLTKLSIRNFHTCLTVKCAADSKETLSQPPSLSSTNSRKFNCDNLFENNGERNDDYDISREKILGKSKLIGQHPKSHKSMKDIARMYPNAKGSLHNIYQKVKSNPSENPISFKYSSESKSSWKCTIDVTWPEKSSFSAISPNKINAGNAASVKCIYWLESIGRLKKGVPIVLNYNELQKHINRPVELDVKAETLNAAKQILDKYEENIKSIIDSHDNTLSIEQCNFKDGFIIDPVGRSNPATRTEEKIQKRNDMLQARYQHRMKNQSDSYLPITNFRQKIIDEIGQNNVLVIKGDTGCGKTTQVPQYIMDSFAERGCATDCNIIVAQPRRISAISLAERIADEREEQITDVIGYQVRLSQQLPNTPAGILFCTNGILLRKMQFNPTLEGCSHVIIDEAHERTINTDMLLVLLKRALQKRPDLKVIIMSATINAELFQRYFNCNVIEIPGRTFPVDMHFMEDIDQLGLQSSNKWDLTFANSETENPGPTVDIVKMGELISYISRKKPPGAILCFLPGWSEITKLKKYLEEYSFLPHGQSLIVPVHSRMSPQDQRKIFSKPRPTVRKIVLATDIAETGITVTDVVYVIDSCTKRQVQLNEQRGFSYIEIQWASQANISQRKGRAGRVKPGESYHFITRDQYELLPNYPEPEIKRLSLEKTVLDAKTYSNEKAIDFLTSMPEPPSLSTINQATKTLRDLGAVDHDENLTPLGKRISLFTLTPQLSKSIVYASIFQCVSPIITIASLMSEESEIFVDILRNKTAIREIKSIYHPSSDHVSVAWLFQQWYSLNRNSMPDAREFAFKNRIVHEKMFTLSKVREINAEHLYYAQMLTNATCYDELSAKENEYSELDELCRGVLLSGLDQVLYQRDFDIKKGQMKKGVHTFVMEDGSRATITPESVNFKRNHWPSPFLTYVRRTHNEERRTSLIRETSVISPLTVFLFSQARIFGHLQKKEIMPGMTNEIENNQNDNNNNNIHDDNCDVIFTIRDRRNVKLTCSRETADVLLGFRDAMWSVVRYLVANYGAVNTDNKNEFQQVELFKMELLQVLSKMLVEASTSIDAPQPGTSRDNINKKTYVEDIE